jgi:ABC-type multidrug transport system fused ATPase/permease subunit
MKNLKIILKWILGILCIIFGIFSIKESIIASILFTIASIFLIPPIFQKINKNQKINRVIKNIIPIIAVFAAFMAIGVSGIGDTTETANKIKEKEKEEYAKLTEAQKDSIDNVKSVSDSLRVAEKQKEEKLKRQKEIEKIKKNTISSSQLYAAYDANEVSADQNFKNKTFYVTGIVEEIKKNIMGNIYVTLKTGQMFSYVNCYFDNENAAANLKKGQRVTFKGKCAGMVITLVTMEDCEIKENIK